MKIEMDKVPRKGYVYSVGDELFFDAYSIADGRILLSDGRNLSLDRFSEIHFFDEKTEYRIICDGDKVRTFLLTGKDDINNTDYVTIREDTWVQPEFQPGTEECRIAIINRFEYTDDDRLFLAGYRLSACSE